MSMHTKNYRRRVGGALASPYGHESLRTYVWQMRGLAASLILALCAFAVMAQESPTVRSPRGPEQTVAETQNRVTFSGDAFFSGPIPYWSDGFLITRKIESFSATTPNVALYGRDGSKSAEVAVWLPGSERVVINSAAVSHQGGILASGEADKADGTRAPFIAFANVKGEVNEVIQTRDFFARNICEAPDGSIWAFGGMRWDASKSGPLPGNVLRRFDLQKGETAGYIPRSTFPPKMQADSLSHIRCTGDEVVVYSNPAKVLIAFSYKTESPRIYAISAPRGLEVLGFAVTNSGDVYGALDDQTGSGKDGMYELVLDPGAHTGYWQPVKGAVGQLSDERVVSRVWGVDGNSLVVSRGGDSAGGTALHWVTMSPK